LLQQIGLTFGLEENLVLSKVPQFAGGLAPTDAALVTAKPSKQGSFKLSGGKPGMS